MRNSEKIISVVTATYNYGRFLPDCLKSVKHSVLKPLDDWQIEHIVVDDGSTDGTPELFASKIDQVRYFRWEKNRGVSAARNFAIKQARGRYVFVLDADDVITQRCLHSLLTCLLDNCEMKWVYGGMLRVNNKLNYRLGQDYFGWKFNDTTNMLESIFRGEHFLQHNVLFEKDLFIEVGGYDENLSMAEDLDLFIKFLLIDEMPGYTPAITNIHRFHGKNASKGYDMQKHLMKIEELKKIHYQELVKRGLVYL